MNLQVAAAKMVLGLLSSSDLVDIAVQALVDGSGSLSLGALAGENDPNWFEASSLFERGLRESDIASPSKREATWILLMHYLSLIATGQIDCYAGMMIIDNTIYRNAPDDFKNGQFLGDGLKIEHCYTWYRELEDAEDGSMLLYYSDLPKKEAISKFREHLIEEAAKALERIQREQGEAVQSTQTPFSAISTVV